MIWIMISQTMAALLMVEADAPTFDHGETEDKPIPVPNASRISDNAAATNAPAITAVQDTPDEYASFLTKLSANPSWPSATVEDTRSMLTSSLIRWLMCGYITTECSDFNSESVPVIAFCRFWRQHRMLMNIIASHSCLSRSQICITRTSS